MNPEPEAPEERRLLGVLARAARRLLGAAATLLAIITLSFLIARLAPGSPFESERALDPAVRAALETRYGLDRPMPAQWLAYLGGLARLDFGPSLQYPERTVREILAQALPHSLLLGLCSLAVGGILAFLLGTIAAARRGSALDQALLASSTLALLAPSFVVGPVLLIVFASWLGWFDVFGWGTAQGLVLPVLTLAPAYAAALFRLVRQGISQTLDEPFIRAAIARGNPGWRVLWVHALRPGLKPAIGYFGPAAAALLTGTLAVEKVFAIPGLGKHFVDAALGRDVFLLLGTVVVYSAFLLALTAATDALAALADPRIRR